MAEQGNNAAMREALEEARKVIEAMGGYWARKTLPIIDAALAAQPEPPSDAAAMREALVQCGLFLGNLSRHGHPTLNPGDKCTACAGVDELRGIVVRALSMPARNCDIGTAEEQWSRFEKMCSSSRLPDDPDYCSCKCKVDGGCVNDCALIWAQMPYEKQEDK